MLACDSSRILVSDDEATISHLFELIITMSFPHKKVDKTSSGLEAVRLFQEHRQGVILMDLHMSEMDGLQAFQAILEFCEKREIRMPPVIFITGFFPAGTVYEIVGNGSYHALLHKPVRNSDIVAIVKAKLELMYDEVTLQ